MPADLLPGILFFNQTSLSRNMVSLIPAKLKALNRYTRILHVLRELYQGRELSFVVKFPLTNRQINSSTNSFPNYLILKFAN